MKVLHINSYYAESKFFKNLYENQINMKLDIAVCIPAEKNYKSNFFYGEYSKILHCFKKYDRFFFKIKQKKILNEIEQNYNVKNYDILHAHSLFANGYSAMKLKKKYDIPYIVAVRNTDINIFFEKLFYLRKIGIEILKNADKIIFLSESYENMTLEKYIPKYLYNKIKSKSEIIPNGIDEFWFNNIYNKKREMKDKKINILYVGEINKNKNLVTTIKACKLLIKEGYNLKYTVVGKISDKKIYDEIKKIDFLEYNSPKKKEELIGFFRNADIFAMPSITETFGLVYAEAMSQGLPLIYSRGQGFDNQFSEGSVGYSVNSLDESEILDKIKLIILNYNEISKNSIEKIDKFNWKNVTKRYSLLYGLIKPE